MHALRSLALAGSASLIASIATAQPQWTVAPRPAFDISGPLAPDSAVLERPIGGVLTSQSRVLIADALAGQILVLDRNGRLVRRVGRHGDGPGEFRSMEWIGVCASDSVVVWDRLAAKLTYLDPDGSLTRQVRAPFPPGVAGRTITVACARTGMYAFLTLPREPKPIEGQVVRGLSSITLVDASGIARTLPTEVMSGEMVARRGGGAPRPLGRSTSIVLDSTRLFVGTADSGFVAVFELGGRPMSGIRIAGRERAIEPAEYEAAVQEVASSLPPAAQKYALDLLLTQPPPRRSAPYYGLHLDPFGALWVRASAPTESLTRFAIVDRSGRLIARLTLPRAITVWDIGADRVLGSYLDDAGEPHVIAYAYQRQ